MGKEGSRTIRYLGWVALAVIVGWLAAAIYDELPRPYHKSDPEYEEEMERSRANMLKFSMAGDWYGASGDSRVALRLRGSNSMLAAISAQSSYLYKLGDVTYGTEPTSFSIQLHAQMPGFSGTIELWAELDSRDMRATLLGIDPNAPWLRESIALMPRGDAPQEDKDLWALLDG